MRFAGKIALITAVASGIGRATADIMAKEGATIVGVDNNAERLEKTVAEIIAAGGKAHGRLCDALDKDQVDHLVDSIAGEFNGIDILVNAVGGSTIIPKSSATVDELKLRRVEEAHRLQPRRHVPLHPCGGAGDEAAEERQDRQPRLDRRARAQRRVVFGLCRRQGRHHRLHQEARLRTRPLRHQHQRDRAEHAP